MDDEPQYTMAKETVVDQRTGEVILRTYQLVELNEFRDVYVPALENAGYTAVNWWEYDFMIPSGVLRYYLETERDRYDTIIKKLEKQITNAANRRIYAALDVLAGQIAVAASRAGEYDKLLLQIEIERNKYMLGI